MQFAVGESCIPLTVSMVFVDFIQFLLFSIFSCSHDSFIWLTLQLFSLSLGLGEDWRGWRGFYASLPNFRLLIIQHLTIKTHRAHYSPRPFRALSRYPLLPYCFLQLKMQISFFLPGASSPAFLPFGCAAGLCQTSTVHYGVVDHYYLELVRET